MIIVRPTTKPMASIKEYDPRFPLLARRLINAIGAQSQTLLVEHIGSTAVPGCPGKGIIDLMVVYPPGEAETVQAALESLGFHAQGPEFRHRDSFPEGHLVRIGEFEYEGDVFRSYVHAVPEGSPEIARFRLFRDRLRQDGDLLAKYVAVKRKAIEDGITDTDDYVVRKIAVINEVLGG